MTRRITLDDEAATVTLAEHIAGLLRIGDAVLLQGSLGVGKSVFARALLRRMASDPELEVPSPTFTLVQPYDTPNMVVHHFDLYRLSDPDELLELGLDEALVEGAVVVEWPQRLGHHRPERALTVTLLLGETADSRHALLEGTDNWSVRLREVPDDAGQ